ncbi:hypothetical protein [Arthrobacter sp. MYb227]|uniref:hypothetical protein n=1 Tax=Arthrobacter sp. MYb227 TaxID=1848601 RepID=UPI0011AFDDB4|nr:hypothetical protein [Arthrobacter sp. MYb227]
MDERLSGQSLVGPVIILGGIGFIISGIVGWSVGMLMQDFDPIHFAESSTHINVTLIALAVFSVTAYLTNAYARFGAGKPTNLGERLYELQHRERGFYAPEHMDKARWLALRENTTKPWEHLNDTDQALVEHLLGCPVPSDPWQNVRQDLVLAWRNTHPADAVLREERILAKKTWMSHPSHWIRLSILAFLATGMVVLAIDSRDIPVLSTAIGSIGVALLIIPPLIFRATRSANRGRTAVLARNLLWTRLTVNLIDIELEALTKPISAKDAVPVSWFQPFKRIQLWLTGA